MANTGKATIRAMEEHIADDWFHITLLTPKTLITGSTKTNQRSKVLEALEGGADPEETVKKASPMGQGPSIVPLKSLEKATWTPKYPEIFLWYADGAKTRKARMACKSPATRDAFLSAIQSESGLSMKAGTETEDFWSLSTGPIIGLVIATLAFVFPTAVMFATGDTGPVNTDNLKRNSRALGEIVNTIGPLNMLLIGLAINAGLVAWWYWKSKHPPMVNVLRVLRANPAADVDAE